MRAFFIVFSILCTLNANADICSDQQVGYFMRGDADHNGILELNDSVQIGNYMWMGTFDPCNLDACDVNDDGVLNGTDVSYLNDYLFLGGSPPPWPTDGNFGFDESGDNLFNQISVQSGGQNAAPVMVNASNVASTIPSLPLSNRWDASYTTTEYQPGTALFRSENNGCHQFVTNDWFESTYNESQTGSAHATHNSLHSGKDGVPTESIRVQLYMLFSAFLDSECINFGQVTGNNKLEVRLGAAGSGTAATLVVYMQNLTQSGKDYQYTMTLDKELLFQHIIYYDANSGGHVTGGGDAYGYVYRDFHIDYTSTNTTNNYALSGASGSDKFKVQKVVLKGLVHRSLIGIDEISKNDFLGTEVSCEIKYKWRSRAIPNPTTDDF